MKIGYACLTMGVPGTALRSCTAKNATPRLLEELIDHNLSSLEAMLRYNRQQGIPMLRVSSDIIPFGSSPVNTLDWLHLFASRLAGLGELAAGWGMRLSMHPGQYTVLNSPDAGVVERAKLDLAYHTAFLDALGLDRQHKIILHIGGVYGDKPSATRRFLEVYQSLDAAVKARLVIENDDRLYHIGDVLEIGLQAGIPVVFDNLHNQVNPCPGQRSEQQWAALCAQTWRPADGRQKTHYSQQDLQKKPGSHSATIRVDEFLSYLERLSPLAPDIMLEVKDKNLSALKCINCTRAHPHIRYLEEEWARYKYNVLEHSQSHYQLIRALLKDKSTYPARQFYALLEEALAVPATAGSLQNAAQHVWGYCKNQATPGEGLAFQKALAALEPEGPARVKRLLLRLAGKYKLDYLLNSHYFTL